MTEIRICLRDAGSEGWVAGSLYIQNLAHAIATIPDDERGGLSVAIATQSPDSEPMRALRSTVDEIFTPSWWETHSPGITRRTGLALPASIRNRRGFDVVYPGQEGEWTGSAWAAWIPDLQHLHFPDLFTPEELAARESSYARLARVVPMIVFSSTMARDDFRRGYPEARAETEILHFASWIDEAVYRSDPLEVVARYELPERFILVSNQFWAHKDHETIVRALAELRGARSQGPFTIVCTGSTTDHRDPSVFPRLESLMEELGVTQRFRILGHIPRGDQLQLMRGSVAVIQPSRFEGWSTVVEDARALGKPILLSDFPVHLEQAPPYARIFPMQDAAALAREIEFTDELPAGPDPEREELARQAGTSRLADVGRRFLEIARRLQQGETHRGGTADDG